MAQVEEESFRTSILYWLRVFEERSNTEFVRVMGGGKSLVARWRTLSILAELSGLTINDLTRHTQIERTALSHLLTQMEKEELIRREPYPNDRRIIGVHLTEAGHTMFEHMLPVRRHIFREAAEGIPEEDLEAMLKITRKLVDNLDRIAGMPPKRDAETPEDQANA
ncbi:MarR family transcriptional regulator [Pseudooceanicola sp. CBS1P-1]|uniref:MarR family transcriptional regulator n=1 Tax=Pseudooceanicola albus TaxID=2692189 RepID=A0A6L7GB00_9RHOB|nr:MULTISPECIES: MarR family transcriptional regulator [Pseudooceanicola]MBT9386592.1 MarR family transcriptional regulator [Pseudooceanicola endophyticus]MXN20708.1 MarR family transcriptional regulator [Pseudooceanicola albus]